MKFRWIGLITLCLLRVEISQAETSAKADYPVLIEQFEDIHSDFFSTWSFADRTPDITWRSDVFGLATDIWGTAICPGKLSPAGKSMLRNAGYAVRITGTKTLPPSKYEIRLRSANHARLFINKELKGTVQPPKGRELTTQEKVDQEAKEQAERERKAKSIATQTKLDKGLEQIEESDLPKEEKERRVKAIKEELAQLYETGPPTGMPEHSVTIVSDGSPLSFRVEAATDKKLSEISLTYKSLPDGSLGLLGFRDNIAYSKKGWEIWGEIEKKRVQETVETGAAPKNAEWNKYWQERTAYWKSLRRPHANVPSNLPAHLTIANEIDRFIGKQLAEEDVIPAELTTGYEFVRRIYLDVWGLIPTWEQVQEFISDSRLNKRDLLIDRLLADKRWADPWVGYWEDLLAENPTINTHIPNTTGPFKDWIYDSFANNHGMDRFVTELVLMEGDHFERGTLGFHKALENDVPMADKANIISLAFMSAQMACARCHDSIINDYKQRDLFGIASLLNGGEPVAIPETSSTGSKPGRRKPLVQVTSFPGDKIPPHWVFEEGKDAASLKSLLAGKSPREHRSLLAQWITENPHYARVIVNRVWQRFMGDGLVNPVDTWDSNSPVSHPELLEYLANEFVWSGHSIRRIQELILKSQAYQRKADTKLAERKGKSGRLYATQILRRMTAEQLVDSLFQSVRRTMNAERMVWVEDYGYPERLWQMVSLSNEGDTEILSDARPVLQGITDLASAFGWREQRPVPLTDRMDDPTAQQPLTLANGTAANRLFRLTDNSFYTKLSHQSRTLEDLADLLFLNVLSRKASSKELDWVNQWLGPSWEHRRAFDFDEGKVAGTHLAQSLTLVDHGLAKEIAKEVRKGEPITQSLTPEYAQRLEDVLWALHNSPEFQFIP